VDWEIMSVNCHPPSNRVPGNVIKNKDHALEKDLTKLSVRELLDLKARQAKLLENKFVELQEMSQAITTSYSSDPVFRSFQTKERRSRSSTSEHS
jgi:hypothetical protein